MQCAAVQLSGQQGISSPALTSARSRLAEASPCSDQEPKKAEGFTAVYTVGLEHFTVNKEDTADYGHGAQSAFVEAISPTHC